MIIPPGQVRDKAAHIRGGRGGSAFYPASHGVCPRPAAVEAGLQSWARSSGPPPEASRYLVSRDPVGYFLR